MLDTVRHVATPEGSELELHLAGVAVRTRAWLYDFLIRLAGWVALGMVASFAGRIGMGVLLVGGFLLEWFYPILFEVYLGGQTPGKRACRIAVVCADGRPVGWNAAFIRNTVRFADFLPFFYGVGLVSCLLDAESRRLGDLAAGTVVVHVLAPALAPEENGESLLGSQPLPVRLEIDEQQAIIEYRLRAPRLTDERALELVEIPVALTGQSHPEAARKMLLRFGNFLLGRQ